MNFNSRLIIQIGLSFLFALGPLRFISANEEVSHDNATKEWDADAPLVKLIETTSKAFVFIGDGSGVVISEDGYVLTNYHVAGSAESWTIRLGGEEQTRVCDVVGKDATCDLCLLKIRGIDHAPCMKLGSSATLESGQEVLALGDPFKLGEKRGGPAASIGIVSAVHRNQGKYTDAIQTDCAINPGNSGGPLINLSGELIGLTGQINSRYGKNNTGIAFAIPIDQIKLALPRLLQRSTVGAMHQSPLQAAVASEVRSRPICNYGQESSRK
jgi:S1-C subfamily serine protease